MPERKSRRSPSLPATPKWTISFDATEREAPRSRFSVDVVHREKPAPDRPCAEPDGGRDGEPKGDGQDQRHPSTHYDPLMAGGPAHSKASASRTGRRDACQAGSRLAAIPSSTDTASHTRRPAGSKTKSSPPLKASLTRSLPSSRLTGQAVSAAIAQLDTAIAAPSEATIAKMARGVAPTARRIPISRRRSSTLRFIVVIRPRPPTAPRT